MVSILAEQQKWNVNNLGKISKKIYKSKPNKNLLLLSYKQKCQNRKKKRIPETVAFYKTNCGVDIKSKMVRMVPLGTWKTRSRRWPLHVFYNILDQCLDIVQRGKWSKYTSEELYFSISWRAKQWPSRQTIY